MDYTAYLVSQFLHMGVANLIYLGFIFAHIPASPRILGLKNHVKLDLSCPLSTA